MNATQFSRALRSASVELKTNASDTGSVSIIRVDVSETLVFNSTLTQMIAQEDFIARLHSVTAQTTGTTIYEYIH
jgi:hypothetical protein